MMHATHHRLTCDQSGCDEQLEHDNPFDLWCIAETDGWAMKVRKDGERAARGGKDYCPQHRPGDGG